MFDQYEDGFPSDQLAIDMLPGWNCSFPRDLRLEAGPLGLFHDRRISWGLDQFGSLDGRTVLEVGPLEGLHTHMINQRRPKRIDAVEANRISFMRCLIAAQILQLDRARFWLGDVSKWLEGRDERYDLIIASGVLYHMQNPPEFLRLAALRTDALFLWTHYMSEAAMPASDTRRIPFSGRVETRTVAGVETRCYERSYKNAEKNSLFCGGMADRHYWMDRDDIIVLLGALGFDSVEVAQEQPDHPGGPCFCVMARRTGTGGGSAHAVQP